MTPPKPSRRRLTQARARGDECEGGVELERTPECTHELNLPVLRTRTGRRRSWWQRGWKR